MLFKVLIFSKVGDTPMNPAVTCRNAAWRCALKSTTVTPPRSTVKAACGHMLQNDMMHMHGCANVYALLVVQCRVVSR